MKDNLKEYAADSQMEEYSGIVLDPEKNEFKIITGYFHDKKDFYEKMVKRGLVLRKCYEKAIWNWIQDNAPDDLVAYLMYSTAFSKWRGNNILSDYYVKLLNDIPALNRETRKGDPNSKGSSRKRKAESIMMEDNNMPEKKYYKGPEVDKEWATTRKVRIYPADYNKQLDPEYVKKPFVTEITAFDKGDSIRQFDDPDFYRFIFKLARLYKVPGYYYCIIYEDNPSQKLFYKVGDLVSQYYHKNKNPYYNWVPSNSTQTTLKRAIERLQKSADNAREEGATDEAKVLDSQVARLTETLNQENKDAARSLMYLTPEEREDFYDLIAQRRKLSKISVGGWREKRSYNATDAEDEINKDVVSISNKIKEYKDEAMRRYKQSPEYKYRAKPEADKEAYAKMQSPAMSNPAFNGAAFDNFAAQMDRRNVLQNKVKQNMKRVGDKKFLDIDLTQKPIIDPDKSNITKDDLNKAFSSEKEREFNNSLLQASPQSPITIIEDGFKEAYDLSQNDFMFIRDKALDDKLTNEGRDLTREEKKSLYSEYAKNLKSYQDDLQNTYVALTNQYKDIVDNIEANFIKDNVSEANKYKNLTPSLLNDTIRVAKKDLKGVNSTFSFIKNIADKPNIYKSKLDFWYNKIKDQLDTIANKTSSKKEAAVNDGVTAMYRTMPIGGQPRDTYQTNKGILPVGGMFLENDIKETAMHKELNQNLFDGDKLKADVKEAFLDIANKFKESLELPFDPVNVYFTGSNANYNYNDQSDIDLHLVYDFERVGVAAEILSKYLQTAKKVFNSNYDITVKGLPVEVGAEDLNKPLVATAVYSVQNDEWIRKPNNSEKELAEPDMPYYTEIINEIESAIQSHDSEIIGNLWKKLGKLRKDSLEIEGEFGAGNALFKKLRNEEYLMRLKDAYYNSVSDELSLEALEEIK